MLNGNVYNNLRFRSLNRVPIAHMNVKNLRNERLKFIAELNVV